MTRQCKIKIGSMDPTEFPGPKGMALSTYEYAAPEGFEEMVGLGKVFLEGWESGMTRTMVSVGPSSAKVQSCEACHRAVEFEDIGIAGGRWVCPECNEG